MCELEGVGVVWGDDGRGGVEGLGGRRVSL